MSVYVITEVSQKQGYIFKTNKLKDMIAASDDIKKVTEECDKVAGGNLRFTGAGRSVYEFADEDSAEAFVRDITARALYYYPGLELFAVKYESDTSKTVKQNIDELFQRMEFKKSMRLASLKQKAYGVEETSNTGEPVITASDCSPVLNLIKFQSFHEESKLKIGAKEYKMPKEFDDLIKSSEKSFIGVVHIDGNSMGTRIEKTLDNVPDQDYLEKNRSISESIEQAYQNAINSVYKSLAAYKETEKDSSGILPIRSLIGAGDDICFVCDGQLALECSRVFLEALYNSNDALGKPYTACAGIAIVHSHYPFYRAYELAEELCSNAKKTLARHNAKENCSAMDWHVEYGELHDNLSDMRSKKYTSYDGNRLNLRPLLVCGEIDGVWEQYGSFKNALMRLKGKTGADSYARSKLKALRDILRNGKTETESFIGTNGMAGLILNTYGDFHEADKAQIKKQIESHEGKGLERHYGFCKPALSSEISGKECSYLFDILEVMDTYEGLEGE